MNKIRQLIAIISSILSFSNSNSIELPKNLERLNDLELVMLLSDRIINSSNLTKEMQTFHDVYSLDLEIGSGGSFNQFFIWSNTTQGNQIITRLKEVKLESIVSIREEAIQVAFPEGIPEVEGLLGNHMDLSESQENALKSLYMAEEDIHGLISEKLAIYARKHDYFRNE